MATKFIFRSQLNELIKEVTKSQFAATAFNFNQDLSQTGLQIELPLKITHNSSGYYFQIGFHPSNGRYRVEYLPGSEPVQDYGYETTWLAVIRSLRRWFARIRRELSEPDPWLLLNQGNVLTDQIPANDNLSEKFNDEELNRLHKYLQSVREFLISETKPDQDQLKLINERLSYLEHSAKRQSKQDWAHTAIGIIFTIAIGLAMAPEQANKLFALTAEFIRSIFINLLPG